MHRLLLALSTVVFWSACGRVEGPCPDAQPAGAELLRRADVVVVGTVARGEVEVHWVVQGRLREYVDRGKVRVDGDLPDGLALVPLRLVNRRYLPAAPCFVPVIPLAWRPKEGAGLEEILVSKPPDGASGPVTPAAVEILVDWVGRGEADRLLAAAGR